MPLGPAGKGRAPALPTTADLKSRVGSSDLHAEAFAWSSFNGGLYGVVPNGTLRVAPGAYDASMTILRPCTIQLDGSIGAAVTYSRAHHASWLDGLANSRAAAVPEARTAVLSSYSPSAAPIRSRTSASLS